MTDEIYRQLEKEGRVTGKLFREVFEYEYWVTEDFDEYVVEWQVQDENMSKSVPYLLFCFLKEDARNVLKELYLERYHSRNVLPPWETVPIWTDLTRFMDDESGYFDLRLEFPFHEFLKPGGWELVGTEKDVTFCDVEMFPVTTILATDVV